jgi:hypothetical protein
MKTIIKNKVMHFARRGADKLNKQTEKLSPLQKKIAVILFCLLCSLISAHIIIKTILLKTPDTVLIHHHFTAPHIGKSNDPHQPFSILPDDFNRIEWIKKELDSLAVTDKPSYDSIISLHPGIMDTIALFEKIYQSQLKK